MKIQELKMIIIRQNNKNLFLIRILSFLVVITISLFGNIASSLGQSQTDSDPQVQEFSGLIEPGTIAVYRLLNLEEGQRLYARMDNSRGNLDPFMVLFEGDVDAQAIEEQFTQEIERVIAGGGDPLVVIPELYDELSLAWNDDFQGSFNAQFSTPVPSDGDYFLLVAGSPGTDSFGSYRLVLGLNEPEVLDGTARSTGDNFAVLDPVVSRGGIAIQEVTGIISDEEPLHTFTLGPLSAGDTLYAYVERTTGDLKPMLGLEFFNGKPLRVSNITGESSSTNTQLKIENNVMNLKLSIGNLPNQNQPTYGAYRLLIGKNSPDVLSGNAEPEGLPILQEPIEVSIGSRLIQITGIDQLNEKYSAVAQIRMEWQDPFLAFNSEDCQCQFMTYSGDSFYKFADSNEILIPEFRINNQQGNRWIQNQNAVVWPDGSVFYQEHYTTDLQAPLFDFTKFPFDDQTLYIRIDSLANEDFFTYLDRDDLSEIGDQLGEEEWFVVDSWTEITSEDENASYWLYFTMRRHLEYYMFRIILPIILVIIVSWFTFFLKDFGRRVEVSSATLLTFVAFNFTVSDNLPRLGYLTFMDALLIGAFVVSVIVVIYNVYLKRMEADGREELAHRIDKPMIWLYPVLFLVGAVIAVGLFLL